jgi:hypothetical protein
MQSAKESANDVITSEIISNLCYIWQPCWHATITSLCVWIMMTSFGLLSTHCQFTNMDLARPECREWCTQRRHPTEWRNKSVTATTNVYKPPLQLQPPTRIPPPTDITPRSPCGARVIASCFYLGSFFFFFFLLSPLARKHAVRSFALITHMSVGWTEWKWSVRLNIDFIICIKSIVFWLNLGKMTTNFISAWLLRNRSAEWCYFQVW